MKNLIGLITAVVILVSCSNDTEQRKLKINQKIEKLRTEIKHRSNQKRQLKEQFEQIVLKYESTNPGDLSDAEQSLRQAEFEDKIRSIELQQQQIEKNNIMDELEIRHLEIEHAECCM